MKPQPAPAREQMRINKAALFAQLRYEPHPGQLLVHESRARFRVLACGTRWGKSTCAAHEAIAALLAPSPNCLGWIVAPTVELTRFVMDRVRITLLDRMPHRVIEDDERSNRLLVRNLGGGTSELRAKSTDAPANLLGQAVDFLVVDEAAKIRDDTWQSYLSPRLIDRKGWALFTSTPRGAQGWFYDFWKRGQKGRDPEFESWRAPTLSNPHINREVVEAELRRMGAESYAQEFEARFLGEENEPCESCGYPSETLSVDILLADYETEPRCPLCGGIVDLSGRTRNIGRPNHKRRLIVDGGPGLRARLGSGPEFTEAVHKMRVEFDRIRTAQHLTLTSDSAEESRSDSAESGSDPAE